MLGRTGFQFFFCASIGVYAVALAITLEIVFRTVFLCLAVTFQAWIFVILATIQLLAITTVADMEFAKQILLHGAIGTGPQITAGQFVKIIFIEMSVYADWAKDYMRNVLMIFA